MCSRWLLKMWRHLIQLQIIVKFVRRILYWLLNAGGCLFQVVIRAGLTVLLLVVVFFALNWPRIDPVSHL